MWITRWIKWVSVKKARMTHISDRMLIGEDVIYHRIFWIINFKTPEIDRNNRKVSSEFMETIRFSVYQVYIKSERPGYALLEFLIAPKMTNFCFPGNPSDVPVLLFGNSTHAKSFPPQTVVFGLLFIVVGQKSQLSAVCYLTALKITFRKWDFDPPKFFPGRYLFFWFFIFQRVIYLCSRRRLAAHFTSGELICPVRYFSHRIKCWICYLWHEYWICINNTLKVPTCYFIDWYFFFRTFSAPPEPLFRTSEIPPFRPSGNKKSGTHLRVPEGCFLMPDCN